MKRVPRRWTGKANPKCSHLPALIRGQPEVWLAGLSDDPARHHRLLAVLSPDERLRCENLKRAEDRQRLVLGRGMVRLWFGAYLNLPPERVAFDYGPFGKPRLAVAHGRPELHFNLSHSGNYVIAAFSATHEIGIDVEQERPESEWGEIASSVVDSGEFPSGKHISPAERSALFFRAWTKREAVLKAHGVGLGQPLAAAASRAPEVQELDLPAGYFGAVALAN